MPSIYFFLQLHPSPWTEHDDGSFIQAATGVFVEWWEVEAWDLRLSHGILCGCFFLIVDQKTDLGRRKKTQFTVVVVSWDLSPITKNSLVLGRVFFLVTLRLTGQLCSWLLNLDQSSPPPWSLLSLTCRLSFPGFWSCLPPILGKVRKYIGFGTAIWGLISILYVSFKMSIVNSETLSNADDTRQVVIASRPRV